MSLAFPATRALAPGPPLAVPTFVQFPHELATSLSASPGILGMAGEVVLLLLTKAGLPIPLSCFAFLHRTGYHLTFLIRSSLIITCLLSLSSEHK